MVDPRATSELAPALPAPSQALAAETWILHPPGPGERSGVMRPDAAAIVDGLLARVARGHGALDVAIGEQLDALSVGDQCLRLGYSNLGDYARERLGVSPTTARNLAKLARELRGRPSLREAVRSGEVSARKAQAVLPVARGDDEAAWVERARSETVRALEVAVREARCGGAAPGRRDHGIGGSNAEIAAAPGISAALTAARAVVDATIEAERSSAAARVGSDEEEVWERVRLDMTREDRARLDRAMALAGRLLGAGAPRWQRLEAICQEFLGAHGAEPDEDERAGFECTPVAHWLEGAKDALEREMDRWDFLEPVPGVPAPVEPPAAGEGGLEATGADGRAAPGPARPDPLATDARLRELAAMRDRWDVLLGHLGMLMKTAGLWRDAGFASYADRPVMRTTAMLARGSGRSVPLRVRIITGRSASGEQSAPR